MTKTAVITGGSSGMGKATALKLAEQGYRVIIHGRDAEKVKKAAEEISAQTGNSNVEAIAADVSSFDGMKTLADKIKSKTDIIDSLILSTGVILPTRIETADGLEAGFVIQYLSRFAITQLLLPLLERSERARIVMVGAPKMKNARIHFDDLSLKNNFSMMSAMAQEMYANHLFTQEFATRNPDNKIVINMLHVGIAKTGIVRSVSWPLKMVLNLVGKDPAKLTDNIVYLATSPEVTFSGYFLPKPNKPEKKSKLNYDTQEASRLWEVSMNLIRPIL